jgi:hypothetical protein
MHARELVEIAALVAGHGPVLVEGPGRISSSALHQYWAASKCRLDRWLRALKRVTAFDSHDPVDVAELQHEIQCVLEEILVAEIALRVWTAVLYAYDRRRQTSEAEPIARSILLGQLDIRQRSLALLVHSPHIPAEQAVELNRLRRKAERWTDLLLGYLGQHYAVSDLAFDAQRCAEFAADLRHEQRKSAGEQAWRLALASLRMAFRTKEFHPSPNADTNFDIAGSILACFPAELFGATGELQSLWLVRLSHSVNDAQGMLDELLSDSEEATSAEAGDSAGHFSFARLPGLPRRRRD